MLSSVHKPFCYSKILILQKLYWESNLKLSLVYFIVNWLQWIFEINRNKNRNKEPFKTFQTFVRSQAMIGKRSRDWETGLKGSGEQDLRIINVVSCWNIKDERRVNESVLFCKLSWASGIQCSLDHTSKLPRRFRRCKPAASERLMCMAYSSRLYGMTGDGRMVVHARCSRVQDAF